MQSDQAESLSTRANGYMVWLRLILPALMAVGVFQLNTIKGDLRDVKSELTAEIKDLRNTINSDVRRDLTDVKERLSAVEAKVGTQKR